MGNRVAKAKTDVRNDLKTVYNAQDTFVQSLVECPHAHSQSVDDCDTNSVRSDDVSDEVDSKAMLVDIHKYEYPFENLVFEGGGTKCLAYCGAIQVLEETGIYKNVKRFAGTSGGAMTASLLAVGYTSAEIETFLSQDISKVFLDHSCGYFSLIPNLIKSYGWNSGKKIYEWFGRTIEEKTGNPDITFNQIYEMYGKELCIIVTNLNMMNAEYFHPKTTPDVPVRLAVRMSMSLPGLFKAPRYVMNGEENTYVDGGVLCNYPVNCYDGWWLSMKMEDCFLNKLHSVKDFPKLFDKRERFGTYNRATLGFMVYADTDRDVLMDSLQQRVGAELPDFPKTKLAQEKIRKKMTQEKVKLEYKRNLQAVTAFLKVLKKHNKDRDDKISKSELRNAFSDTEAFPKRYAERLFGKNVSVDAAMSALDEDGNGEVYFHELVHLIERTGISLQARFLYYQRKEINGFVCFFETFLNSLLTNAMRVHFEECDVERTVGINTGHVDTTDMKLEQADRDFVIQQGRRSTVAFLRYYVVKNNPAIKSQNQEEPANKQTTNRKSYTNGKSKHLINGYRNKVAVM